MEKVETYNRVMAEQTEEDKHKFYHQQKKVREFCDYVAANMVPKVGTMETLKEENAASHEQATDTITAPPPKAVPPESLPEPEMAQMDEESCLLQQAIDMI